MLESDALRAWYGEAHVLKAVERGAVGKLLISDEIFRCAPLFRWLYAEPNRRQYRSPSAVRRKKFVKLVEDVKAYGGEVLIFSSMHESGQRAFSSPVRFGFVELTTLQSSINLRGLPPSLRTPLTLRMLRRRSG